MEEKLKLSKESTTAKVDATQYRSIIGGLHYLTHTRPDIGFAVGYLSRFMEDPCEDHFAAVKKLLCYVARTIGNMAGDVDGQKSTIGVLFVLNGCPISWQSHKQRLVTLSTCVAEYIAAATVCCQGVWQGKMLQDLTGEELCTPILMVDNKSAIALAKNPVLHDRSKHIDTKYHFICDCVVGGQIKLEHVETARQLGDILTKPLGCVRLCHTRFIRT
jgi:hypothetical protein